MTTIRNPLFENAEMFKQKVLQIKIKNIRSQKEFEDKVHKYFKATYWDYKY